MYLSLLPLSLNLISGVLHQLEDLVVFSVYVVKGIHNGNTLAGLYGIVGIESAVGGDDAVLTAYKGTLFQIWTFADKNVQPGGKDLAGIQSSEQSAFVNLAAPGDIEEDGLFLHLVKFGISKEVHICIVKIHVAGDNIGVFQQIVKLNFTGSDFLKVTVGNEGVVSNDFHAEGL